MDEGQTAKMIRFAATSTDRRKEKIMEGVGILLVYMYAYVYVCI